MPEWERGSLAGKLSAHVSSHCSFFAIWSAPGSSHGPWTLVEADCVRGRKMNVLAIAEDRPPQCRRPVGGSGGRGWR